MMRYCATSLLLLLTTSILTPTYSSQITVTTETGTKFTTIPSTTHPTVASFKGIRYGEAPIQQNRWKRPKEYVYPSSEIANQASEFGSRCLQQNSGELIGDEDCENFPISDVVSQRQCNDICIDTPYCQLTYFRDED